MQIVGHLTSLNTFCESPTEGAELELNHSIDKYQ